MKIKLTILLCTFSLLMFAQQKDSIKVEIKNLGSQVNSAFSDYAPLISADGTVMVFTSRRPAIEKDIIKDKESTEHVYTTYYDDKNSRWLVTFMLGTNINTPEIDNSAIALSNDGQRMFVYRGGNEQNSNGDILESVLEGDEWSEPVRLPYPINTDDNETSASIAPDGRTIYFVSDRRFGYGGRDIWFSTQDENGNWSDPINAGRNINTPLDEEGVFIHPNGKVLFFSSMGHNSIGGYDIFMSVFDETTQSWSQAQNIGVPVNTTGDDIYFVMGINGKTGYYASIKEGGLGGLDIYSVTFAEDILKRNVTILSGRVLNSDSKPIASTIVLTEKKTGKYIGTFKSNKLTGKFLVSLTPGKKYVFKISSPNYKENIVDVDVPFKAGYSEMFADLILEKGSATVDENADITELKLSLIDVYGTILASSTKNGEGLFYFTGQIFNENTIFRLEGKRADSLPEIKVLLAGQLWTATRINTEYPYTYHFLPDEVKRPKNAIPIENVIPLNKEEAEVLKKAFNNLEFDTNKATIKSSSFASLNELASLMTNKPTWKLRISGHTDNKGNKDANLKLSKNRSEAVKKYLVKKGIDSKRFKAEWFGSSKPIADNTTEAGRQQNRRVEMVIFE